MAGFTAASVGLGVGVWLAASFACVGGGLLCCFAPAPTPFATAPWLSPRWQSTIVLPRCTVCPRCRPPPPFTVPTTTPFSSPCGYGTHTSGPAGALPPTPLSYHLLLAAPPRPPLLPPASAFPPLPPLHPPSRPSLVVCPFRFVAAFFLFGGFGGLGFTSSTSLLELTVVLELEEEE